MFGCSEDETTNGTNNISPTDNKYLVSARTNNFHDEFGYDSDTLIYNNGKLFKALFFKCSGALYQFEYNSFGKVSKFYTIGIADYTDLNTDLSSINSNVITGIYNYNSNQKIIRIDYFYPNNINNGDLYKSLLYDYDVQGRMNKTTYIDDFTSFISLATEFDSNGNAIKINGDSFMFDGSVNPFYVLYEEFGITGLDTCTAFDQNTRLFINPNNIETIIDSDGDIYFSNFYTSDEENYPTSSTIENSIETYNYLE